MKLTSSTTFIETRSALDVLNENFVNPIRRVNATLLVEPAKGINYGVIGMAYDYWIRCEMRPTRPDLLETFIGYRVCLERYSNHPKATDALNKCVSTFSQLRNGTLPGKEDLFSACLFLAKFEIEFRSGYLVDIFDVNPKDIDELHRIANATDITRFQKQNIVLNPIFCLKGSKLQIAADGDIMVEGALIDLKTSSKLSLKGNIRQLIGYWALNELSPNAQKIERLGVYYPRFNYYADFSPSDLMAISQQKTIKEFFSSSLGNGISHCS